MRTYLFASVILLGTTAAAAAGGGDGHELGTSVEMPYLIAPLVENGDLVANAYISSVILATSPSTTILVRDRLPFIQDAFVRDVGGLGIGKEGDPTSVDVPALAKRLQADAVRVAGRNVVRSLNIVRVQVSPLNNSR